MNINYKLLKEVCLAPIEQFYSLGTVTETRDGIYIYKENPKAKVLGVAHLDSVLDLNHFYKLDLGKDTIVFNAQLDDRLGAYVLLDILPKMGIEFDLLLTEGEEQGMSTAAYFETEKQYNWMFSFDRHGDDVVSYQYDIKALRADLAQAKFKNSIGSFSDICFLSHLGIRGFNVGVGYENEHSNMCYANINMMIAQIKRFHRFYELFKNKRYDYTPEKRTAQAYPISWERFTDDLCYICDQPSPNLTQIEDVYICDDCIGKVGQCTQCYDIVLETDIINGLCSYCRGDE